MDVPGRARYDLIGQCSFKIKHYQEMLEDAVKKGYVLTSFKDYLPSKKKTVILRHDLDHKNGMKKALRFARIEQALGCTSTYFVRLHSPTYNPFDYRTYYILREILNLGHEIGLHTEAVDMQSLTGEDEKNLFLKEKGVLESILDIEVLSASQHGDYSAYSHSDYHYFFDRVDKKSVGIKFDAKDEAYTSAMKYLSDSNSVWLEGCLCGHLGREDRYQVLTHPEHWFEEHYHTW